MSTALYNEAIADAKELVRMAEQNATNKLVEAVAPRIRRLVEKKLLNEEMDDEESEMMPSGEDEESDDAEFISSDPEEEPEGEDDEVPSDDDFSMGDDDMAALGSMFSSDSGEEEDDDDMLGDFEGGMRIPSDRVKRISIEFDEGDKPKNVKAGKAKGDKPILRSNEGMELTKESISTLLRIVDGSGTITDRIKEARLDLKVTGRALGALNEGRVRRGAALRIVESFNGVLRRALALQAEVAQLPRGPMRNSATSQLATLTKEIKEMSTRSMLRALLEREETKKDNEGYEGKDNEGSYMEMYEADEEDAAPEEGGEEGDMSAEDVLGKIKDLLDQMGGEEASEEEPAEEEPAEEEEPATEGDYNEMGHEGMMESRRRRDPVYTIDESMLRRELLRLRRLREEVEPTDSFGGPPEEEEDLESVLTSDLNVYGDELGSVSEAKKADAKMKKMKEMQKAKAAKEAKAEKEKEMKEKEKEKMKEARMNRALKSRLSEAVTAINSLRRELNEQKLFNAKLLYVNKLMQNKAISERQLRSIVEALDGAGTLREAQLLYKSLTESLSRSSGGNLTEGANRIAGNSSRSTRPGGLVNESVEVDRWAVLAGLKG